MLTPLTEIDSNGSFQFQGLVVRMLFMPLSRVRGVYGAEASLGLRRRRSIHGSLRSKRLQKAKPLSRCHSKAIPFTSCVSSRAIRPIVATWPLRRCPQCPTDPEVYRDLWCTFCTQSHVLQLRNTAADAGQTSASINSLLEAFLL